MVGCESVEHFLQRETIADSEGAAWDAAGRTASEYSWQLPDGRNVTIRENIQPVFDGDGRLLYYAGTLEDVTDHRRAVDKLRGNRSPHN